MFKKLPPLALIVLLLPSCIQTVLKDHNFTKGNPVEINGAQVVSSVKPMGGKGGFSISAMVFAAATGSLDGPFLWRVEAEGVEGEQEWIRVNEARVTTEKTKRSEPFPKKFLGQKAPFEPIPQEKGKSFAKFQIPGKLTVFPRTDGKIKIHVNVSVHSKGRTKTEWILFEMDPESKWTSDTIFLPTEIVKNFKGNPREWDW